MIGKKGRGRPRAQSSQNVEGFVGDGLTECKRETGNRKGWRSMTVKLRTGEGT